MKRILLIGAALLSTATGACSSGPKTIAHDKPLPGCAALPGVLSGLGMPGPQPGPQVIGTASTEGFDCSFTPPAGTQPPATGYASVVVLRPNRDPYEGKSLAKWGGDFPASAACDGTRSDDPAVPHGSLCYSLKTEHTGSATVASFAKGAGIRVNLQWTDLDASPEKLRSGSLDKANALIQALIGML